MMTHYQSTEELLLEVNNHTLWIVLNRPDKSNAFTTSMISDLVNTLYRADEDNSIRSIVITGAGKHFCAGGDVHSMQNKEGMFAGEPNELRERYKRGIQKIPRCIESLSTPLIAMVNGAAIGAGLDLACMCDIRIASKYAKFGETFTKLGLIPGDGGTYFLQRVIGYAKAMELTLTGDIIDSDQAFKLGLISQVCEAGDLEVATKKYLKKINDNAPIAVQMAKRAIIHSYQNDLASLLDLLSAYQGITQRSSDHFEAVAKVFDKDSATFKHS